MLDFDSGWILRFRRQKRRLVLTHLDLLLDLLLLFLLFLGIRLQILDVEFLLVVSEGADTHIRGWRSKVNLFANARIITY